jgi:hypothetical protein
MSNYSIDVFIKKMEKEFVNQPMVIYGTIYNSCTYMYKVDKNTLLFRVDTMDQEVLDDSVISKSTKEFKLPIIDCGSLSQNHVTVKNYYDFWMPLEDFIKADSTNEFKSNKNNLSRNKTYKSYIPERENVKDINKYKIKDIKSKCKDNNKLDNKKKTTFNDYLANNKNKEKSLAEKYNEKFNSYVKKITSLPLDLIDVLSNNTTVSYEKNRMDSETIYYDITYNRKTLDGVYYLAGWDKKQELIFFRNVKTNNKMSIGLNSLATGTTAVSIHEDKKNQKESLSEFIDKIYSIYDDECEYNNCEPCNCCKKETTNEKEKDSDFEVVSFEDFINLISDYSKNEDNKEDDKFKITKLTEDEASSIIPFLTMLFD